MYLSEDMDSPAKKLKNMRERRSSSPDIVRDFKEEKEGLED